MALDARSQAKRRRLPATATLAALCGLGWLAGACAAPARVQHAGGAQHAASAALPGPGAAAYTTEALDERDALEDPDGLLASAFSEAARSRGVALRGDARLRALSGFVADHISPDGALPSQAAIDLAARHLGLVEPTPHFVVVGGDSADGGIAERVRDDIAELLSERSYSHFGGVVRRRDGAALFVAALVFRFVELSPVPRMLRQGEAIELSGTLTHGHTAPELAVTEPSGRVVRGEPGAGDRLAFRVAAAMRGIYRVEVLGQGPMGITVVANFPVYVDEAPPTRATLGMDDEGAIDPERAAQRLLDMINAERAKVGLAALARAAGLDAIASAHTGDMLAGGFVAHTSPTTGSAADRVSRAGVRTSIVLENIGRGYSLSEVHDGLLSSPGHRGNILHPLVTHVGIGVSALPESGHTAYLVTQLFVRVTPELASDAADDLLRRINEARARTGPGLAALRSEPALAALAARSAQSYFSSPPPSDSSMLQALRTELARTSVPAHSVGAAITVVGSVEEIAELDAVLDPAAQIVGLGLAQGTRADGPTRAICAVILVGQ